MQFHEITVEVSASALRANLALLRARCPEKTRVCIPLKADAYGHGLRIVADALRNEPVDMAGVATLDEAIRLRAADWSKPILVFGAVLTVIDSADRQERIRAALDHDLTLTVVDDTPLEELHASAARAGRACNVHLKVDTGMGRMGTRAEHALSLIEKIRSMPHFRLTGIYSHFGCADLADPALVDLQLAEYRNLLTRASDLLGAGVLRHFANSAATLTRPDAHFDMVRPGIAFYGLLPADRFLEPNPLRPALRVVSRVSAVKAIPAGHCVGYACTHRTTRPTRLGIVPVGYHDGFLRRLSNRMVIGTDAGDARVLGRVSMDQMAVDLTDMPAISAGSRVMLIDPDARRPNSVESIARLLDTISYEVVCGLGPRMERVLVP